LHNLPVNVDDQVLFVHCRYSSVQRFAFAKHGRWAGLDSAWKQEKLEARAMPEKAAESHTSGARFVGQFCTYQNHSL